MSTKTAKHSWFSSPRLKLSSWSTQALPRKSRRKRRRSRRCSLISNRSLLCPRLTATRKRMSRHRSKTSSRICLKIQSNSCSLLKSTRYSKYLLSVFLHFSGCIEPNPTTVKHSAGGRSIFSPDKTHQTVGLRHQASLLPKRTR